MQRSSLIRIAFFALACLGAIGCTDEGIGDPCIPETIPCDVNGDNCGYKSNESYIEASSVQCRSRLCLVYKLDNLTAGTVNSDPRVLCTGKNDQLGCLTDDELNKSVYCTCRCGSGDVKTKQELCSCGSGYTCETILNLGGPGIIGSYCVKSSTVTE